jgi:hypothetical protein
MKRLVSLFVTSLFPIAFAFGQLDTGQITGSITDVSSAVIGQASITVVNANTGLTRSNATAQETKSMCTYSSRRMLVGSTLAARIAGMTAANVVTKRISARTLP